MFGSIRAKILLQQQQGAFTTPPFPKKLLINVLETWGLFPTVRNSYRKPIRFENLRQNCCSVHFDQVFAMASPLMGKLTCKLQIF